MPWIVVFGKYIDIRFVKLLDVLCIAYIIHVRYDVWYTIYALIILITLITLITLIMLITLVMLITLSMLPLANKTEKRVEAYGSRYKYKTHWMKNIKKTLRMIHTYMIHPSIHTSCIACICIRVSSSKPYTLTKSFRKFWSKKKFLSLSKRFFKLANVDQKKAFFFDQYFQRVYNI